MLAQILQQAPHLKIDLLLLFNVTARVLGPGLYADNVHPNAAGHAFLAEAVARHIVLRLQQSWGARLPTASAASTLPDVNEKEECYPTARLLPVAAGECWHLVDEGNAKGVQKLGYISARVGDWLRLGPVPLGVCGVASANVGYLRSWRPDQGALVLSCASGCKCKLAGCPFYNDPRCHTVQTSSIREHVRKSDAKCLRMTSKVSPLGLAPPTPDCNDDHADATVTVPARLAITNKAANGSEPCFVQIMHGTWPHNHPLNASRVRVDYLSIAGCK